MPLKNDGPLPWTLKGARVLMASSHSKRKPVIKRGTVRKVGNAFTPLTTCKDCGYEGCTKDHKPQPVGEVDYEFECIRPYITPSRKGKPTREPYVWVVDMHRNEVFRRKINMGASWHDVYGSDTIKEIVRGDEEVKDAIIETDAFPCNRENSYDASMYTAIWNENGRRVCKPNSVIMDLGLYGSFLVVNVDKHGNFWDVPDHDKIMYSTGKDILSYLWRMDRMRRGDNPPAKWALSRVGDNLTLELL